MFAIMTPNRTMVLGSPLCYVFHVHATKYEGMSDERGEKTSHYGMSGGPLRTPWQNS